MKRVSAPPGKPAEPPAFFSPQVATARRFYSELNPSSREKLVVVCGGLEHCTADYAIKRETFPYCSIEYVARGCGELKLKGKPHRLRPGTVFAYCPGVPHEIRGDREDPLVKYFVDFAGTRARGLLRDGQLEPGTAAEVFPPHSLASLFDELIETGLSLRPKAAELSAALLECIALKIAGQRAPAEGATTLSFITYQNCRRHMETHFLRLRTLEEIASECHLETAYLCRLFRRYDSQPPYQYLLRLKILHAAQRLHNQGVLVKQVAEETGFADAFHFSRVFRKVLGVSPLELRRLR